MRVFHCDHCGQLVFFENVACLGCGRVLAFLPERRDVVSLDPIPGADRARHRTRDGLLVRLCGNYVEHQTCNWAVASGGPLCRACALTRTIPDLAQPGNERLWFKLEAAKRRLVYTFDELGLALQSKGDDLDRGLAFDFLEGAVTGHDTGVITVALEEADEVVRAARQRKRHLRCAQRRLWRRALVRHLRRDRALWTHQRLCARRHPQDLRRTRRDVRDARRRVRRFARLRHMQRRRRDLWRWRNAESVRRRAMHTDDVRSADGKLRLREQRVRRSARLRNVSRP